MKMRIKTKSLPALIYVISLLTFLLSSCATTPDNITPTYPTAGVSFIQASPDQPLLNLFVSNTRINSSYLSYGQTLNNFTITPGKFLVTCSSNAGATIVSDSINFKQNAVYSIFLANTVAQPELFLLTDTISKPTANNANIRFVNVSPDAPAVDLVVKGGSVLVANRSFKGFSSFAPIPGNTTYTIEVHQAGTNIVLATLSNINLNAGYVYTFWFHGLAAATASADKLTLDVINNADFF